MLFLLRRARQSLHHQSRCRTSSRRNACLLFATTFVGTRRTVVVVVPETKASSFVNLLDFSGASSSSSSSRSCVGSDDGLCVVFSNALFAAFLGTGGVRRRPRVLLPRRALWQISSVCRRERERESRVRTQVFVRLFSLLREDVFF